MKVNVVRSWAEAESPLNNGAPESGGGRGCSRVHNLVDTPYLPPLYCLFSRSDLFQNSLLPLSRNRLPSCAISMSLEWL